MDYLTTGFGRWGQEASPRGSSLESPCVIKKKKSQILYILINQHVAIIPLGFLQV